MKVFLAILTFVITATAVAQVKGVKQGEPTPKIQVPTLHPVPAEGPKSFTVGKKTIPAPPKTPGCYRHTKDWEAVPCLSSQEMAHILHPSSDPSLGEDSALGPFVTPTQAELDVDLVKLGGLSDSVDGPFDFSLQLNSTPFHGANGQIFWVQFVFQTNSYSGQQHPAICVWNIHLSTQDYGDKDGKTSCVSVPNTWGPATGDTASLIAFPSGGSLNLVAVLPWAPSEAGASDAYSVSSPDVYGLLGPSAWHQIDGNILGQGNSSVLTFTKSCVTTTLSLMFTNGLPNNTSSLETYGKGGQTGETNNLDRVTPGYGFCSPLGFLPATCSAKFDQVSQDWPQGQAACYPHDVPIPPLQSNNQAAVFEDDNTQMTFNGTNMHVCPGGNLLVGLDVQNNRFLCSNFFLLPQATMADLIIDSSTHASFNHNNQSVSIHVCPDKYAAVGWNAQKDWLVCRLPTGFVPLPNFGDIKVDGGSTETRVTEPDHPGTHMHACNTTGNGGPDAINGIDTKDNLLVCVNSAVTPRLQ